MLKTTQWRCPQRRFGGRRVTPKGAIALPFTLGVSLQAKMVMVDFLVVDNPSPYNALMESLSQNDLKAIGSSPHLKVKFLTPRRIGEVKRDQTMAREFYNTPLTKENKGEALTVENLDLRNKLNEVRVKPIEDLIEVQLREY
ncbi:hypothetical protein REPUB_Repub16aG0025900 [Reevesia pubescens]